MGCLNVVSRICLDLPNSMLRNWLNFSEPCLFCFLTLDGMGCETECEPMVQPFSIISWIILVDMELPPRSM